MHVLESVGFGFILGWQTWLVCGVACLSPVAVSVLNPVVPSSMLAVAAQHMSCCCSVLVPVPQTADVSGTPWQEPRTKNQQAQQQPWPFGLKSSAGLTHFCTGTL